MLGLVAWAFSYNSHQVFETAVSGYIISVLLKAVNPLSKPHSLNPLNLFSWSDFICSQYLCGSPGPLIIYILSQVTL